MHTLSTRLLTRARWVAGAFARPVTALAGKATAVALAGSLVIPASLAVTAQPAEAATRDDVVLSFDAAGIDFGYAIDWQDYANAARRFGVSVGTRIDGADIDRIVAAAWNSSVERFATAGIGIGERPDASDYTDAARWLGVDYGTHLSTEDAARILAAGRARVGRALHAAGIDYGTTLDTSDVKNAAARLGIGVGSRLDPQDTSAVVDAAWLRVSSPLMATARGVRLYSPSPRAAFHGWHQASGSTSVPMHARVGRKLPSRGRGTAGTSAVDVALDAGDPVRAPVSGRVVEVRPYRLYGKYVDYRIRIVPDDNPGMLATLIHVTDPKVRPGQRVRGGADLIAGGARKFPFTSQIDRHGGGGRGHVHIELRPR